MTTALAIGSWYILSTIIGLVALPLTWRLFGRLPDRGFGFARAVGLLGSGYLLWLGASVGLLQNMAPSILGTILFVGGVSLASAWGRWDEIGGWIRESWSTMLTVEGLFLLSFLFWCFVRSSSPEIVGTEKPMELAFINSVVHSRTLPPFDPWLSGFAISYYYFGFVLVGMITQLTGVAPAVAFNLANALWFALSLVGAFTVVHNLIAAREGDRKPAAGLLGPLFVVLTGNLEGFLEVLHARGLFWRQGPDGEWSSGFWSWLDIKTLVNPPMDPPQWIPDRHWWWWRASRVVRDLNLAGVDHEVIDEFPFFSFLLADNHPHVLALPFVLLAVGFALQIFLQGRRRRIGSLVRVGRRRLWALLIGGGGLLTLLVAGGRLAAESVGGSGPTASDTLALQAAVQVILAIAVYGFLLLLVAGELPNAFHWGTLLAAAWMFGALAFLNTWDFPIYLSVIFFVVLYRSRELGWRESLPLAAFTSLGVLLLSVGLYLPWFPTFSSQAGGVLPNVGFPTKTQHFIVMFGPLLAPIVLWLIARIRRQGAIPWRGLLAVSIGLPLCLWLVSWALSGAAMSLRGPEVVNAALELLGAQSRSSFVQAALQRRLHRSWTALALGTMVALSWALVWRRDAEPGSERDFVSRRDRRKANEVWPFVAISAGLGALLVLGPEFLYLRDLFGTRMNTVFKFYFAAWILWGLAAAYGSYRLWRREGPLIRVGLALPVVLGLFYPVMSLMTRTGGFSLERARTLDGSVHLISSQPGDARAIDWLNQKVDRGVVAEAVGGSYSQYARISTYTGLATVLGWDFHEVQWRGSAELQGSRRSDIERLYTTRNWREAKDIVEQYEIDYVYVGSLERLRYGDVQENKFEAFLQPVYRDGETVIFATLERAELR